MRIVDLSSAQDGASLGTFQGLQGVIINVGGPGSGTNKASDADIQRWCEWGVGSGRVLGFYVVTGTSSGAVTAQDVIANVPAKYRNKGVWFCDWENLGSNSQIWSTVEIVQDFCNEIDKLTGGVSGIYGSVANIKTYGLGGGTPPADLAKRPFWSADYYVRGGSWPSGTPIHTPGDAYDPAANGWKNHIGIQFTDELSVGQNVGAGATDGSIFSITAAQWHKLAGGKVNPSTTDPNTGKTTNPPGQITTTTVTDNKQKATTTGYKSLHRTGNAIFLSGLQKVNETDTVTTNTSSKPSGGTNTGNSASHKSSVANDANSAKLGKLGGIAKQAVNYILNSANWNSTTNTGNPGIGFPQNYAGQTGDGWAQCYALSATYWWYVNGRPDYSSIAFHGVGGGHLVSDNEALLKAKGWKVKYYPDIHISDLIPGSIISDANQDNYGHTEVIVSANGNSFSTLWQNTMSPTIWSYDNTGRGGETVLLTPCYTMSYGHFKLMQIAIPPEKLVR